MRILITGGTGFIGTSLIDFLKSKEHEIILLTRYPNKARKDVTVISQLCQIKYYDKIDGIINLAGAPIDRRWSVQYKQELISSRVIFTEKLIKFIENLDTKPQFLISASAIGYYGSQNSQKITENSNPKEEFTHELCKNWENQALKAKNFGVRVCIVRLGVVLGKNGGALLKMLPAFKLGLGGKLGLGSQMFSWVHKKDVIKAIDFLINNNQLSGAYNLTAPNAVSNLNFTKTLGKILNRPTMFSIPAKFIQFLFGEMGQTLLLNGQNVYPEKLLEAGFEFEYPTLDSALNDIIA